ncbi:MAG: dihydroorotate dehydrogenase electron transfer subunit [Bacteroidales bacterium]|jgi:dihydroorotate dehydrogenase electron transfer subunit|nr:dihydroorotate dehydrogenase electron transfer subunit [Bacteroidales bacterium]
MSKYSFVKSSVLIQYSVAEQIFVLEVALSNCSIFPGQFFLLKNWDQNLPLMRPISVFKTFEHSVQFLYKVIGQGTAKLAQLQEGDAIELLGPLGNGFPCHDVKGKIALLGGGIGIPPLYETAKKLTLLGNEVSLFLGYRDKTFCIDDFAEVSHQLFIASESGLEGYQGFITELLHPEAFDAVLTCGPEIMMKTVRKMCLAAKVPVWLSMEKRMGCGIGACLVCNCETTGGMKRCCTDGPIFNGNDLIF